MKRRLLLVDGAHVVELMTRCACRGNVYVILMHRHFELIKQKPNILQSEQQMNIQIKSLHYSRS